MRATRHEIGDCAGREPSRGLLLDWMRLEDDAGIRALLCGMPMGGDIRLVLAREPSYVEALCVEGDAYDVLVARERGTDRVVGIGSHAVKTACLDGSPATIGYLGGLRFHPDYRNGWAFLRAYPRMLEAVGRRGAALTLTTILDGNERAVRLLTSGRMGLPTYHDAGRFHTLCYAPAAGGIRGTAEAALRVATAEDQDEILDFLRRQGTRRQAFPAYRAEDWGTPGRLLRNLQWTDMLLAVRHGRLVGCVGLWDQRPFRQSVVAGYSGRYRAARPLWNLTAPLRRRPLLPPPGSIANARCLAALRVADDDPAVCTALLCFALRRAAAQDADQVAAGFHETDPLLHAARRIPHLAFHSRVYAVTPTGQPNPLDAIEHRPLYLELGAL